MIRVMERPFAGPDPPLSRSAECRHTPVGGQSSHEFEDRIVDGATRPEGGSGATGPNSPSRLHFSWRPRPSRISQPVSAPLHRGSLPVTTVSGRTTPGGPATTAPVAPVSATQTARTATGRSARTCRPSRRRADTGRGPHRSVDADGRTARRNPGVAGTACQAGVSRGYPPVVNWERQSAPPRSELVAAHADTSAQDKVRCRVRWTVRILFRLLVSATASVGSAVAWERSHATSCGRCGTRIHYNHQPGERDGPPDRAGVGGVRVVSTEPSPRPDVPATASMPPGVAGKIEEVRARGSGVAAGERTGLAQFGALPPQPARFRVVPSTLKGRRRSPAPRPGRRAR